MNFEVLPLYTAAGERYLVIFDNGEVLPDSYDTEDAAITAAARKLGRSPGDYFVSRHSVCRGAQIVYKLGGNTK